MALESGTTLLHYRLDEKIGEGGMGVVWKALDTTLDREVAIKVLPEALADNVERLSRFEREAKILAALNHPNISAVYGFHEDRGVRFLAMEYVPGEDLAVRLARGPIGLEPALEMALQIIDALEAAHDQGIVHRDLKPANVRITPDGLVKVLDLGLAKAFETEPGGSDTTSSLSPTMTSAGTIAGVLLGTAGYMSPEQARGHPADRRSDIWAFGATLFEMLTGTRPFIGDTISDTLASILKLEPEWGPIEAFANPPLERLLARCLAKKRSARLHHIADARLEIRDALAYEPAEASEGIVAASRTPAWRRLAPWGLSLVLAIVAIAIAQWPKAPRTESPLLSLEVALPADTYLPSNQLGTLAISPDGTVVVFIGEHETEAGLFVRRLDTPETRLLEGTDGASTPFFSPDGRWIGYFSQDGMLRKVSVDGGAPLTIGDYPGTDRGGTWDDNGNIYYTPDFSSGLMQIAAAGGEPKPFTTLDQERLERTHRWPQAVRGHDLVLFTVGTADSPENYDGSRIDAIRPSTGERFTLFEGASFARYIPTGHLILGRQGFLFAAPFDIETLELRGEARPVLEGVLGMRSSGVVHAEVSDTGILAYVAGGQTERRTTLNWLAPDGSEQPLPAPERGYIEPEISPDGRRIVVAVEGRARFDLWIYDIAAETLSRLTFSGDNHRPLWSPDGNQIFFASVRDGTEAVYAKASNGLSPARKVFGIEGVTVRPNDVSPDGQWLLVEIGDPITNMDIHLIPIDGTLESRRLVAGKAFEANSRFSPDGRWIVYESTETGQSEVFVQSLSEDGGRGQVSVDGGFLPSWTSDDRILYRDENRLVEARIETTPGLRIGSRRDLVDDISSDIEDAGYTVSDGGKKLLLIRLAEGSTKRRDRIRIVSGWGAKLAADLEQR